MTWNPPKEKHSVVADAFDHRIIDEMAEQAPVVAEYRTDLADDFAYATELVRDLGGLLFKPEPALRGADDVDPRVVPARALVEAAQGVPEMAELRKYTVYDRWATATALGALAEALDPVRKELRETSEAMRDKADAADDAQRRIDDGDESAEGDLQAAVAAMEGLRRDVDGLRATAATLARATVRRTADDLEEVSDLAAGYGIGPADLERMDYRERAELANRMKTSRVRQYMALFGRMKFAAQSAQARRVDDGRDEAYSIRLTDDLAEALPTELAALAAPSTRLETLVRMADGQLLGRKWRGIQKSARGPIVCVIDNSGSMSGDREAYAKALALALMDIARESDRPFSVVQFSTEVRTVVGHDWRSAVRVAEEFLGGGTNYHLALDEALTFIEQQSGYEKADIVLIGDGEFSVDPSWLGAYLERRDAAGVRAWGISVGGYDDTVFHLTCSHFRRLSDLMTPDGVTDLFEAV